MNVPVDVSDKQAVLEAICGYIEYQCSRPSKLHSRDLHSAIVAAFHCISVWITQHADLLDQQVTCASYSSSCWEFLALPNKIPVSSGDPDHCPGNSGARPLRQQVPTGPGSEVQGGEVPKPCLSESERGGRGYTEPASRVRMGKGLKM